MKNPVGPVLRMGDEVEQIIAAIEDDNPGTDIEVIDRGAYVRVQAEDEITVTQQTLRRHLGADYEIRSFGAIMSAFGGRAITTSDAITWQSVALHKAGEEEGGAGMTETPARKPGPRRTFSAFGDVRRMPSEYEIVTQGQNWTLRQNRAATFEQNPSSAANLWFLTYRDNSPLQAENWDAYRDPDALTYKAYVTLQSDAETKVHGVLEAHAGPRPWTRHRRRCSVTCSPRHATCVTGSSRSRPTSVSWHQAPTSPARRGSRRRTSCAA